MSKDPYHVTDLAEPCDTTSDIKILRLPMRDGVKLQTIIYFPPELKGKRSVLLLRTSYTRTTEMGYPYAPALKRGIIFIIQACRGTGWSEGVFDPADGEYEINDACDTLLWLKKQPWYNGRCAMTGGSYPGFVQWCAQMAGEGLLTAVTPHVAPIYSCIGSSRPGGAASLGFSVNWMLSMHHRRKYGYSGAPDYNAMKTAYHLPPVEADRSAGYPVLSPFRKFLLTGREPWKNLCRYQEKFKSFTAPAYITGGWFDPFISESVESFLLMKSAAKSAAARQFTRMVIGPWGHAGLLNPDLFGKTCDYRHINRWRERFIFNQLKAPEKDPLPAEPAVRYYMLCENKWYASEVWPPAGTRERRLYLHSGGDANSCSGSGILSEIPPQKELCDVYVSDPAAPVLSDGGDNISLGCYDRTPQQKRSDVLVYTTQILTSPLTVAGHIKLAFTAEVSTPDTDFAAVLSWVTPEGKAMLLARGMLRARFRNMPQVEMLEPGKKYDFEICFSPTAFKIVPGCALRLEISGQHFPAFDRNANSGKMLFEDTKLFVSRHTVYHDGEHPAYLTLPCLD